MKSRLFSSFSEGFRNSFRLSTSLVMSVAATIATFAHQNRAAGPVTSDKRQRGEHGLTDNQKTSRKPRKR